MEKNISTAYSIITFYGCTPASAAFYKAFFSVAVIVVIVLLRNYQISPFLSCSGRIVCQFRTEKSFQSCFSIYNVGLWLKSSNSIFLDVFSQDTFQFQKRLFDKYLCICAIKIMVFSRQLQNTLFEETEECTDNQKKIQPPITLVLHIQSQFEPRLNTRKVL